MDIGGEGQREREREREVEDDWEKEREGICQFQQTLVTHTLTCSDSHDTTRRHCTESTNTTMDLTHTHAQLLHRVLLCVPMHSPGGRSLAVSCQENNKITINKPTDNRKIYTPFGSHWA